MTHCDDLIEDETQPASLRAFLEFNRRPAIEKVGKSPRLFATMKADAVGNSYTGKWGPANPIMEPVMLKAGQRVRVVMASRFGDVGITPDLDATHGYVLRVSCDDLENFSDA